MRATEIKTGQDYAVPGNGIELARVTVRGRTQNGLYVCQVVVGQVYNGWMTTTGHLDMSFAEPGELVRLSARDILRTWDGEQERRTKLLATRENIRSVMSEMDDMLTKLGLPDAHMQLVHLPGHDYMAVAVLGIDDLRTIHANTRPTDPEGMV